MSYNKRVAVKIRSVCGPLRMGRREMAKIRSIGWDLERFLVNWVFGGISEKGSRRKHTGNRVTSWSLLYWGNSGVLR
jgi:hypothetical protein